MSASHATLDRCASLNESADISLSRSISLSFFLRPRTFLSASLSCSFFSPSSGWGCCGAELDDAPSAAADAEVADADAKDAATPPFALAPSWRSSAGPGLGPPSFSSSSASSCGSAAAFLASLAFFLLAFLSAALDLAGSVPAPGGRLGSRTLTGLALSCWSASRSARINAANAPVEPGGLYAPAGLKVPFLSPPPLPDKEPSSADAAAARMRAGVTGLSLNAPGCAGCHSAK
mmetsp:Transcript_40945/g.102311  ORF Transcript_40945/g.102311 Transcript_40945/m.102311 type:complete len:233 (-) Transcript_40945:169-867(-)